MAEMALEEVNINMEPVLHFEALLRDLISKGPRPKVQNTIPPPFTHTILGDYISRINSIQGIAFAQFAIIDVAIRNVMNALLANYNTTDPQFIDVWILLDICALMADDAVCEAAQLFWIVEELLDSQTIQGCRRVFDYLESRREKIMAKDFAAKKLVVLRTCNELLRRLSRAEDTAFCGRVFIFLFQSFPLHDKSAVNLRGEYHTDNVTTYDDLSTRQKDVDSMDIDSDAKPQLLPTPPAKDDPPPKLDKNTSKSVTFDGKKTTESSQPSPLPIDELYPMFWNLQQTFSQPKRLFEAEHFDSFKKSLEQTMITFESVQKETSKGAVKVADDIKKANKRSQSSTDKSANAFNPKYLTSRDLFELEISDVSFRRHITVQAMIILDFLLSLSPKSKEKQASAPSQNKSVMYQDQTLSPEDLEWTLKIRKQITSYLSRGTDGPFFLRTVDTVLSRDKNWIRWKIESCPPIERPPLATTEFIDTRSTIKKLTTNKRLRPHPMSSLDLSFLSSNNARSTTSPNDISRLKRPRYPAPTLSDFALKIANTDLEIDMPDSEDSKRRAIEEKSSFSWRALRIAREKKLVLFDKLDDPEKIDIIFGDNRAKEGESEEQVENEEAEGKSEDVVVNGTDGAVVEGEKEEENTEEVKMEDVVGNGVNESEAATAKQVELELPAVQSTVDVAMS